MPRFILLIFLICGASSVSLATDPYKRNPSIDILHYQFNIALNDTTNVVQGKAEVTILFKNPTREIALDLIGKTENEKGMTVSSITNSGKSLRYTHQNNKLSITFEKAPTAGEKVVLKIDYAGIPADGLIISINKFGDRTFFGDNWPNRARNWLPTIDHPYDKASCEFFITAPEHYQAIANGMMVEKTNLSEGRVLTHWRETADLPTKVMVIGVARFATTLAGEVNGIPVETWVYPQNKDNGFSDFKIATQVLDYFIKSIGPYPYQKLANVQSTTRYGGMENASNIFYFENSVTGNNGNEALIAHEIAHQWFGDSASEMDWHHVWLSEGFATYFTNLYFENSYGRDRLAERMQNERKEVIEYFKQNPAPVIDTTITDINKVLSTNTYQKAGWVLHMLRREIGDEPFWAGIREYYGTYKNSNALTSDFRRIMEKHSGKDLKPFFDQWLKQAGHPILSGSWSYDSKKKTVSVRIKQNQPTLFNTPIEIGFVGQNGSQDKQVIQLSNKEADLTFPAQNRPKEVVLDPDTWLLFEGGLTAK